MLNENIRKLVQYGIDTGLTPPCEKNYTVNLLLDLFKENEYEEPSETFTEINLEEVLKCCIQRLIRHKNHELSDAPSCTGAEGILGQI